MPISESQSVLLHCALESLSDDADGEASRPRDAPDQAQVAEVDTNGTQEHPLVNAAHSNIQK